MSDVAQRAEPLIRSLLRGDPPVAIEFWDGSSLGPRAAATKVTVRSPLAFRRLLWSPPELGLARAYVAGEIDVDGDVYEALGLRDSLASRREHLELKLGAGGRLQLVRLARELGILGPPPAPPREEARLRGRRHSKRRDADAISHHYDVSNRFYRWVLGATMTYSCAYFPSPDTSLDDAQRTKYDLICRKLGLERGDRLLDVGCGWGGMVMHAAASYGVRAVGITVSRPQADLAAKRAADAGLADLVEIRLQDYRDVHDGPFDAISSIGMFEHVGLTQLKRYFVALFDLLRGGGRLLNHAISKPSGRARFAKDSFIARYVFPDGELHEVGSVVRAMQEHGFEVRDVESLREHYARTLRFWVANLERHWDEAVEEVGAARARIWRLYMAGSALNFAAGRINVHQVLGVKPGDDGDSGMPPTRARMLA
jgi:cyclopropane-fatty-acyl-phospholipid synthase